MPQYFLKQPSEQHDYDFDWTLWLEDTAGDTISTSTVTADPGIVLGTKSSPTPTIVKQFVSGGTHGVDYTVTCRMVTAQDRRDEEEIHIMVRDF